jgi:ABC-2 type transport system ATP-binding protein
MIEVEGLSKSYRVPLRPEGRFALVRSLWSREAREVRAVEDISFRVAQGERVGFLGPNGAGKTTTLKMLAGLLEPSAGRVRVLGHRPQDRDPRYLSQITLVMGQKQQLLWDLPPRDTFALNVAMYDLPRAQARDTLDELVEMLQLAPLLQRPVRNLSLGERMKCELAAALLHRPRVLFLDEPTIGLDVEMQAQVRTFIRGINARFGATVLLTSHAMADIAALTPRLLLIDGGRLRFDGPMAELTRSLAPERQVRVRGERAALLPVLAPLGFVEEPDGMRADVPVARVNELLGAVLARMPDADVRVEDVPLEEVLRRAFRGEAGAPA